MNLSIWYKRDRLQSLNRLDRLPCYFSADRVRIENDLDPRGRNAQTLSGPEGSSNTGCLQQAWNPDLNQDFIQRVLPDRYISANRTKIYCRS